jgi:hypothetical protein
MALNQGWCVAQFYPPPTPTPRSSFVEVTAPIVGTTSLEKLEDLLGMLLPVRRYHIEIYRSQTSGAFDVKLSSEDIKYMEEPYKPMEILLYN